MLHQRLTQRGPGPRCIQLTCSEHFQTCHMDLQPALHPQWIYTCSHPGQKEVVRHYDLTLVLLSPRWLWKDKKKQCVWFWYKLKPYPLKTSRNDWSKPAKICSTVSKDPQAGSFGALRHPLFPSMTPSRVLFLSYPDFMSCRQSQGNSYPFLGLALPLLYQNSLSLPSSKIARVSLISKAASILNILILSMIISQTLMSGCWPLLTFCKNKQHVSNEITVRWWMCHMKTLD